MQWIIPKLAVVGCDFASQSTPSAHFDAQLPTAQKAHRQYCCNLPETSAGLPHSLQLARDIFLSSSVRAHDKTRAAVSSWPDR